MKKLADADVFVNNLRMAKFLTRWVSTMRRFTKSYPHLGLVMRGYGEYGPEKDSPGFDAVCWAARGGVANVFREDGESPAIALRHSATTMLATCANRVSFPRSSIAPVPARARRS